ncbi:MAG TPA: pyruvate, phosphate dikinase, partial [Lentimicrobium sp.]|nr:pyruvate, phosphate dikinase [Lentimicrobium sp.]
YLLIGPGRWGTRDRWIGIPVAWPQISSARVIVETSLEGYPLDASSGSHFFHNVTSMNVGYFSVQQEMSGSFIRWDILKRQPVIGQTKYFRHVRFDKPLQIKMDGKKRVAAVIWDSND